ncbi:MAG: hypothetical protein JNL67_16420 [Planctomycetaceae bacterium]|nr:hypothetical protein [Planctomycetaceae bacterium]
MPAHPRLSLTDFVDVVHASGTPKATIVKTVKQRPDYQPAFDFYKQIRDGIAKAHRSGKTRKEFNALPRFSSDPKKLQNYTELRKAYFKWWGKKTFTWFSPPRASYHYSTLEIFINPELGLEWGGARHLLKLYFKEAKLTKPRATLILDLMESTLRTKCTPQTELCLLDIRTSKLFVRPPGPPATIPLVNAEIAYIEALWPYM